MEAAIGFLLFVVVYAVVVVATLKMKQPPLPFKAMTLLYLGVYYSVAMQVRHRVTMYHLKKSHKHKIASMNSEFKYKVLKLNIDKNTTKCGEPMDWEKREFQLRQGEALDRGESEDTKQESRVLRRRIR